MKILSKNGNEIVMLAMITDTAGKGDYLLIEDEKSKRKMIVQIYDEEYLSSQSLIEDIVKDEVVTASEYRKSTRSSRHWKFIKDAQRCETVSN